MIDCYGIVAAIATQYIEIMMLLQCCKVLYESRRLTLSE